jgi:hypothetical protein
MDSTLTLPTGSLAFTESYKDKTESLRVNSSRGVNTPTELKVAHSDYSDKSSGIARKGVRSLLRFDRKLALADGTIGTVSAYLVVSYPVDSLVLTADIQAVVNHIVDVIQEDDSGLDLADEIFVNKER